MHVTSLKDCVQNSKTSMFTMMRNVKISSSYSFTTYKLQLSTRLLTYFTLLNLAVLNQQSGFFPRPKTKGFLPKHSLPPFGLYPSQQEQEPNPFTVGNQPHNEVDCLFLCGTSILASKQSHLLFPPGFRAGNCPSIEAPTPFFTRTQHAAWTGKLNLFTHLIQMLNPNISQAIKKNTISHT